MAIEQICPAPCLMLILTQQGNGNKVLPKISAFKATDWKGIERCANNYFRCKCKMMCNDAEKSILVVPIVPSSQMSTMASLSSSLYYFLAPIHSYSYFLILIEHFLFTVARFASYIDLVKDASAQWRSMSELQKKVTKYYSILILQKKIYIFLHWNQMKMNE